MVDIFFFVCLVACLLGLVACQFLCFFLVLLFSFFIPFLLCSFFKILLICSLISFASSRRLFFFFLSSTGNAALPEVVFVGRSNVGKSSLVNMLVNRKALAPTSAVPGFTQVSKNAARHRQTSFFLAALGGQNRNKWSFVPLPRLSPGTAVTVGCQALFGPI